MLEELKGKGAKLLVATSKTTCFAREILEHFGMLSCFEFVAGSNLDGSRVKKDEVIAYALREMGISRLEEAVMIGDREHEHHRGEEMRHKLHRRSLRIRKQGRAGKTRSGQDRGKRRGASNAVASEAEASGQGDPVREETDEA